MNNKMTIEFNGYGIEIDGAWIYLALSWKLIATTTILFIGYRFYKTFYKK
mgnify:CR=1 FL=1